MNRTQFRMSAALFAASLLAAPAMAAGDNAGLILLPPPQTQGSVTFITGGVGEEEAAAMRMEEARFPLSMEFARTAQPRAEFYALVNVTIRDPQGQTVLSTVTEGPFLLANVPPGKYTVTAAIEGQAKQQSVVVDERRPEHIAFVW